MILDGFGYSLDIKNNAIAMASTPHGNFKQMVDIETGQPHAALTINPVPLVGGGNKPLDTVGSLSNLASTVLAMLGVGQPVLMTGRSLIKFV
jgi:2,3-bisphosphoglycerate-independent phosphoglycerate mutase